MSTKRKLQEDDDYETQEAGTLSDDELDYDIEDEEEEDMGCA